MHIFLSHASANAEIAGKLKELIEGCPTTGSETNTVYCSSTPGSIEIGKDYVDDIYRNLDDSAVFIPLLTKEYYASRFCVMELGGAALYLYRFGRGEGYIKPYYLPPLALGDALLGTSLSALEVYSLVDAAAVLKSLEGFGIDIGLASTKAGVSTFVAEVSQIVVDKMDIVGGADKLGTYCDDRHLAVVDKTSEELLHATRDGKKILASFNLNPDRKEHVQSPAFFSYVLHFFDGFDLDVAHMFSHYPKIWLTLDNFTDSLRGISVELKFGPNKEMLLDPVRFKLAGGINKLVVDLSSVRSRRLEAVNEICFVVHPDDLKSSEGAFEIKDVTVC